MIFHCNHTPGTVVEPLSTETLELATLWHYASLFYHTYYELEAYINLFRDYHGRSFLDCACGSGFPIIPLAQRGFRVTGCDSDPNAIEIVRREQQRRGIDFPSFVADIRGLTKVIDPASFDVVCCLGSSITYFESWVNRPLPQLSSIEKLGAAINELHNVATPQGEVIIGVCRLYDRRKSGDRIVFPTRFLNGHKAEMTWLLEYDWSMLRKSWHCELAVDGRVTRQTVLSHLVDKNSLLDICREQFRSVETLDVLPERYHDVLLRCRD